MLAGLAGRLGTRYAIRAPRGGSQWAWGSGRLGGPANNNSNTLKLRGRHLLDHEALTCLLVLLFIDEPKINTNRFHRVLRNLCYHGPTRAWVMQALLSILQKTSDCKIVETEDKGKNKMKKGVPMQTDSPVSLKSDVRSQASWLSVSLEAALGCRANVFQIQRNSGKKHANSPSSSVSIHVQAAPAVCRHVLDTLISLAKIFPSQFFPSSKVKEVQKCDDEKDLDNAKQKQSMGASASPVTSPRVANKVDSKQDSKCDTDFWDILVRLDSASGSRKGKGFPKMHGDGELNSVDYSRAPLGHLMSMLSHPVIRKSQLLTDRLIRLLALVSTSLPEALQATKANVMNSTARTTAPGLNPSVMLHPIIQPPKPVEGKQNTGPSLQRMFMSD